MALKHRNLKNNWSTTLQADAAAADTTLSLPQPMLDLLTALFLTRFADRPLYLFGGVGALLSAVGFVILAYLSVLKLATGAGIGQRPLLQFGILSLLVGVQLIGTGFIGDVLRHSASREQVPYRTRRTLAPGPDPTDPLDGDA